jgi:hypothetical protein
MLNILHSEPKDGKVYANVQTVARLPKGMKAPATSEAHIYFSLEPDEFDPLVFESLPNKWKEEIRKSPEFKDLASAVDADGKPVNMIADTPF